MNGERLHTKAQKTPRNKEIATRRKIKTYD